MVFLDGLHGENMNQTEEKDILAHENRLLGPPRIRQIRVRNNSCIIHKLFERQFRDCYGYYSREQEDFEPFGLKDGSAWHYGFENGDFTTGYLANYPDGGYIQDFTFDRETNENIIENLYENLWIDRGTRFVMLEFTIYNANVYKMLIARLMAEKPPSGGFLTSTNFQIVHLIGFETTMEKVLLFMEAIFFVFLFWYTYEEIFDIWQLKWKYILHFWNWIDLAIVVSSFAAFGWHLAIYFMVKQKVVEYNENYGKFVNFEKLAHWNDSFMNLVSLCIFFIWIKVLKYMSFNKTLVQFSSTLAKVRFVLLNLDSQLK
jgi:hypothetical protein